MSKAEQTRQTIAARMNNEKPQDAFTTGKDDELLAQLQAIKKAQGKSQTLALLSTNEIRVGAFIWKPTGLAIDGEITEADWQETGRLLKLLDSSMQWLIGDLIVWGENLQWGDQQAIAEAFGFEYATIRDFAYVCRNVEMSVRTDKLDFGHHKLVAAMSPEEQADWLQAAAEGENGKRWSVARLRYEIEVVKNGEPVAVPPATHWNVAAARQRETVLKSFERAAKKGNVYSQEGHVSFAEQQSRFWQEFAQNLKSKIKKGK